MTKQQVLENYRPILKVKGMEVLGEEIFRIIETVYDEAYKEGLNKGIELSQEVNNMVIKNIFGSTEK